MALEFVSEALKNSKELVLTAVTKDGGALEFASYERQNDEEVVLAAVTQSGMALCLASHEQMVAIHGHIFTK